MRLDDLRPAPGAKKSRKRVGRGTGSGHGKTATRGHKGQKARSGGAKGPGFEGGQNPLQRRLPQFPGFRNPFKVAYTAVNLDSLNVFEDGAEVTLAELVKKGIVKKSDFPVKLLARGELTAKIKLVQVHGASRKAIEAVEKNGGTVEILP